MELQTCRCTRRRGGVPLHQTGFIAPFLTLDESPSKPHDGLLADVIADIYSLFSVLVP
jgi:hypothetical protein